MKIQLPAITHYRCCCTINKFLDTSMHLDEPLDESRFVLNVFWQGTSEPLPQFFHVQDTLDCTLHLFGLTFFLEILFLVTK